MQLQLLKYSSFISNCITSNILKTHIISISFYKFLMNMKILLKSCYNKNFSLRENDVPYRNIKITKN